MTPTKQRRKPRVAIYVGLQEHREEIGWSIPELIAKLEGNSMSERSIRRLEEGKAIRAENANRVFNTIKRFHPSGAELSRDDYVKVV